MHFPGNKTPAVEFPVDLRKNLIVRRGDRRTRTDRPQIR